MKTGLLAVELLLLGLGLGAAALALPRAIPLPAVGRFAFGFSTTPFVMATIMLAASVVWPGVPRWVLALAPGILAAILLWCHRRAIAHAAVRPALVPFRDPVFLVLLGGVLWAAVLIAFRMSHFAQEPLGYSDPTYYAQAARHFAEHRSFREFVGMRGLEDGTMRGDPHGPLWIAWLASAFVWETDAARASARTIVRLPLEASFVFFLASVVAVASALRTRYLVLVSLLACLAVPRLYGTIADGDRDSFRLAGLLLLSSYLLAHLRPNLSRSTNLPALVMAAALVVFAVQGHGLALVLVPIITATWCVIAFAARLPIHRIFILCCALGLGFIVGALHVIGAVWRTGSIMGDNVHELDQLRGTLYEGSVERRNAARIGDGDDPMRRMVQSITRDRGWPSVAAFIVLIGGFGMLLQRVAGGRSITILQWRAIALGGWFVAHTLFVLGAFDIGQMQFGASTIMNLRYAMQWHLAAALLAAWGISYVFQQARMRVPSIIVALAALVLCIGTALLIERTWLYYSPRAYLVVADKLHELSRTLPPNCRILTEDAGVNFYAERPIVQLYSMQQRDLLAARTPADLDALLSQRNFCIIVIFNGLYIDVAGPNTPLARLLASDAFILHDVGLPWRFYVRRT